MTTGKHLKVKHLGSNVLGVALEGNPRRPEPDEFRVTFPGGSVSVVRCTDGDYWAHLAVDHPNGTNRFPGDGLTDARLSDSRVDVIGKHSAECTPDDINHPDAYHVAIRVKRA